MASSTNQVIGAWKCNLIPLLRNCDRPTDHRKVTLTIVVEKEKKDAYSLALSATDGLGAVTQVEGALGVAVLKGATRASPQVVVGASPAGSP